jgi:hypothetical protein
MLSVIPAGQFIGSTIEHIIIFLASAYIAFLWPRRVKRQVATEKITREEGDAKLKKLRPWVGYFLIAWSLTAFIADWSLYFSSL